MSSRDLVRSLVFVALATALGGCNSHDRLVREWRPEDHPLPPEEPQGASADPHGGDPHAGDPHGADPHAEGEATDESQAERQARAAQMLYAMQCASCHGPEGQGDGAGRPPGAQLPNFQDAAWQSSRSDEQLAETLVNGRGMMPAFGTQLPAQAIAALIGHIRALGGQQDVVPGAP